MADPELLTDQYRDSQNLCARLGLHDRFSTHALGFHRWAFARLELCPGARVLELGCGQGALWSRNLDGLRSDWDVTLSDFSPGMLKDARAALAGCGHTFAFERIDAESIPHPDASFDTVVANHMLYHVPNRSRALREIRRVLRLNGRLYAATNGERNLHELIDLVARFGGTRERAASGFTLENGAAQLERHFAEVRLERLDDGLRITESQPVVDYVLSWWRRDPADIEALREFVDERIRSQGALRVTKDAGQFVASA